MRVGRLVVALTLWVLACGEALTLTDPQPIGTSANDAGVETSSLSDSGATDTPSGSVPDGGLCTPGVTACANGSVQTCDADGHWDTGTKCPHACIDGACSDSCTRRERDCVGLVPRECDDEGTWVEFPPCAHACGAGLCGGVCDASCGTCANGICRPESITPFVDALTRDATNLYWSTSFRPGAIMKAPLAGGPPVTLATTKSAVAQITVDASDVYWAEMPDTGAFPTSGSVNRVPIGGGATTKLASSTTGAYGVAVAASGVYWSSSTPISGALMRLPLVGGPSTALATTNSGKLLANGSNIYWTNAMFSDRGDVLTMLLAGGPIVHVASAQGSLAFTIDATRTYWVDGDKILSAPRSGGAPTTHATGQLHPMAVAVDATNLYWVNGTPTALVTVPLSGGTPTTLASEPVLMEMLTDLVVDAKYVYWKGGFGLNRIPK